MTALTWVVGIGTLLATWVAASMWVALVFGRVVRARDRQIPGGGS